MLSFLYLHRRLHIMFRFACLTLICGKLRYMIIETCNNWNYQNIIYPPLSYINDNYVYSHCFVDSYFQDILRQWINISYKIRSKLLQQNIIYFLILSLLFSVIATVSISCRYKHLSVRVWYKCLSLPPSSSQSPQLVFSHTMGWHPLHWYMQCMEERLMIQIGTWLCQSRLYNSPTNISIPKRSQRCQGIQTFPRVAEWRRVF